MTMVRDNLAERSVVEILNRQPGATVAEITEELSISTSTVVGAVSRLLDKGVLLRREIPREGRGRPSYQYSLRLSRPLVAFFLDGSLLAGALFDRDHQALAMQTRNAPQLTSPRETGELFADLFQTLCKEARVSRDDLSGAVMAINGIRTADGTYSSSVLSWLDDTIEDVLADALGIPVHLRDAAMVEAEYRLLGPTPTALVAYLHVGDGVSGHFCTRGRVHRGATRRAGELGHMPIDPAGPMCGCGQRGCLEALISGPALAGRLRALAAEKGAEPWLAHVSEPALPVEVVERLWQVWNEGEHGAVGFAGVMLDHAAWGLAIMMNMLDPDTLIIGGYVFDGHDAWIDEVARRSRRWIFDHQRREIPLIRAQADTESILRAIAVRAELPHSMTQAT